MYFLMAAKTTIPVLPIHIDLYHNLDDRLVRVSMTQKHSFCNFRLVLNK